MDNGPELVAGRCGTVPTDRYGHHLHRLACVSTIFATPAPLWLAQGAHPKTIQMRLGHHSAAFILDVYGGIFESLDEDLADRFDENAPTDARAKGAEPSTEQEARVIPFPARAPRNTRSGKP